MKADLKTKATKASVKDFIDAIPDETRRKECRTVMQIMRAAAGVAPRMWGSSIVGFGDYHYKYASGREGDWFVVGFSPRKSQLTLYLSSGIDRQRPLLKQLGPHGTGKGCLYLKRLSDVDLDVLKTLVGAAADFHRRG
jgi:hypothetical protein